MWDPMSGARERLFLLTKIGWLSDPGQWEYDAVSDTWRTDRTTYRVKVSSEADASRAYLLARGWSQGAVDAALSCGLGAGVNDTKEA